LAVDLDNNEVRTPLGFVLPDVWRRKELYGVMQPQVLC
jgi:hypothetical protein